MSNVSVPSNSSGSKASCVRNDTGISSKSTSTQSAKSASLPLQPIKDTDNAARDFTPSISETKINCKLAKSKSGEPERLPSKLIQTPEKKERQKTKRSNTNGIRKKQSKTQHIYMVFVRKML